MLRRWKATVGRPVELAVVGMILEWAVWGVGGGTPVAYNCLVVFYDREVWDAKHAEGTFRFDHARDVLGLDLGHL